MAVIVTAVTVRVVAVAASLVVYTMAAVIVATAEAPAAPVMVTALWLLHQLLRWLL